MLFILVPTGMPFLFSSPFFFLLTLGIYDHVDWAKNHVLLVKHNLCLFSNYQRAHEMEKNKL